MQVPTRSVPPTETIAEILSRIGSAKVERDGNICLKVDVRDAPGPRVILSVKPWTAVGGGEVSSLIEACNSRWHRVDKAYLVVEPDTGLSTLAEQLLEHSEGKVKLIRGLDEFFNDFLDLNIEMAMRGYFDMVVDEEEDLAEVVILATLADFFRSKKFILGIKERLQLSIGDFIKLVTDRAIDMFFQKIAFYRV